LQKRLPAALASRVQAGMEQLTRVKTLRGVVEALGPVAVAAPAAPSAAAVPSAVEPVVDVLGLLLEVVAERTGYPPEMLGAEQDLEAELGVDSIKRVEILGALQKRLPAALASRVQAGMEQLTRVKTLRGVVEALGPVAVAAQPTAAEFEAGAAGSESMPSEALPRYVMRAVAEALPAGEPVRPGGLVVITEDGLGVAARLAERLHALGIRTEILPARVLADPAAVQSRVRELTDTGGNVAAIAHLAALGPTDEAFTSLAAWRAAARRDVKGFFALLQTCATDLKAAAAEGRACVAAASAFGGLFGRDGKVHGVPLAGAPLGLLKTMVAEWPGVRARAVDLDSALRPEALADQVAAELLSTHREVEIGYPGGARTVFRTARAPHEGAAEPVTPQADWVVLVTAGARGITHQIARELAQPGMTFVIAGRLPEPAPEREETAQVSDPARLRQLLLQAARQAGETPTPAILERRLTELLRAREIRENLNYLRSSGINVEYAAVDVRDEGSFGALVEEVYRRHGRLDAVLHGAGIIEDKLIVDKALDSFDRVFDTKVDSTFLLVRHLRPAGLKLVMFFTSVAGRYGNRGQSDYAAANETVNRFAWRLSSLWPEARVLAVNWGPWDTAGMASEAVKSQFRERGIVPISIPEGRRFFAEELRWGCRAEVEVVAGIGDWESLEAEVQGRTEAAPAAVRRRLLRAAPEMQPNGTVTLVHDFAVSTDPYLQDHRLDGLPVLPATGAAEWMAQFVQEAWPDFVVTELRDLRVLRGLILEDGVSRQVIFRARASSHASADALTVTAELLAPRTEAPFYRAFAILRPAGLEAPVARITALAAGEPVNVGEAYRDYLFHGERFRLVSAIERLGPDGADAIVTPTGPAAWLPGLAALFQDSMRIEPGWLFDPGMLDTAPQLAIVWSRVIHDRTVLPSRIGAVIRYGEAPLRGPMRLALRVNIARSDETSVVYDALFVDGEGRTRVELREVESTSSAALNRLAATA
jgi:NAD(P)-dependent dehydrogenase (short-subunit alcohol dehydrogenase family)/acyl carrier protein